MSAACLNSVQLQLFSLPASYFLFHSTSPNCRWFRHLFHYCILHRRGFEEQESGTVPNHIHSPVSCLPESNPPGSPKFAGRIHTTGFLLMLFSLWKAFLPYNLHTSKSFLSFPSNATSSQKPSLIPLLELTYPWVSAPLYLEYESHHGWYQG